MTNTTPKAAPKAAPKADAPAVFKVVTHIKVDGKRLEPGDKVVLSADDAARMLRSGSVAELDD